MLTGQVVNSPGMKGLKNININSAGRLLLGLLVITVSASCSHLPIYTADMQQRAREEYKTNLLQWNSLAACNEALNPVVPLPLEYREVPLTELRVLNALFRLGFSALSDAGAATLMHATVQEPHTENSDIGRNRKVLIKFDAPETAVEKAPQIAGVLLDGNGWVLTVAHPFSNPVLSKASLYARMEGDADWYNARYRSVAQTCNLALIRFNMPQSGLLPPGFARAEAGTSANIGYDEDKQEIRVETRAENLQLGDSLVFSDNLLSTALEDRVGLISGVPLRNQQGEILGLYYYESMDGTFSGYAGWEGLPGLIDTMIHLLHRRLLEGLRQTHPERGA